MTANGRECWSMPLEKYHKAAVINIEQKFNEEVKILLTKCKTTLKSRYRPELDVYQELKSDGVQYYMGLIGVLRWAVEIGRFDILYETSIMSTHLALPRVRHLEQMFHVFGYLKEKTNRNSAFDPDHPFIDDRGFKKHEWYDFYWDSKEEIPGDMNPPRGNGVTTHCFEDAELTNNTFTRRSQTGILIFINRSPII